jgi:hypothetical protein
MSELLYIYALLGISFTLISIVIVFRDGPDDE